MIMIGTGLSSSLAVGFERLGWLDWGWNSSHNHYK